MVIEPWLSLIPGYHPAHTMVTLSVVKIVITVTITLTLAVGRVGVGSVVLCYCIRD